MSTLTDDDLRHLLGEAAGSHALPPGGADAVVAALEEQPPAVPLRRRRWVQAVSAAAVLAAGMALGAAVVEGGDDVRTEQVVATEGRPASAPQGGAAPLRRSADEQFASSEAARSGEGSALTATGGQGGTAGGTAAGTTGTTRAAAPVPAAPQAVTPQTATAVDSARVVKTGSIALIVDEGRVTPTLTRVSELGRAAGGVVATGKSQESGPTPSGSVTLRVPVDQFEEVVAGVRALDADVRTATTGGQDVTAQYADLEAQLRTLRAARERFLAILARTRTIGDVLTVQQRVDDVTGQIDRLEGQRRVLADQSERATLEVSVTEADDPVVTRGDAPDDGLSQAFADAWDGFTSGVEGLVRLSGRALLLLLCLVVAAVVLRLGWRVTRRRLV